MKQGNVIARHKTLFYTLFVCIFFVGISYGEKAYAVLGVGDVTVVPNTDAILIKTSTETSLQTTIRAQMVSHYT